MEVVVEPGSVPVWPEAKWLCPVKCGAKPIERYNTPHRNILQKCAFCVFYTETLEMNGMSTVEVQATQFARNFPQMKEDVREHGVIAVCSHKRMVGAFISPAVMEELELLRRRKRELTRIEDADEGFFEALDDAVATYEDPV